MVGTLQPLPPTVYDPGASDAPSKSRAVTMWPSPYNERLQDNDMPLGSTVLKKADGEAQWTQVTTGDWEADASRIAAVRAMTKQAARTSIHKQKSRRKMKQAVRKTRPGIKVDTSVSRHRAPPPQELFPQDTRGGSGKQGEAIGLVQLRVLDEAAKEPEPKQSWWARAKSIRRTEKNKDLRSDGQAERSVGPQADAGREVTALGIAGLEESSLRVVDGKAATDHLSPSDEATGGTLDPGQSVTIGSDISLSDGPIPIGISIPSDTVSEHSKGHYRSVSDGTAPTPTIIITPAQIRSVWSPSTAGTEYEPPRRIASSVYSQATHHAADFSTRSDIPPVPSIPSNLAGFQTSTPPVVISKTPNKTSANRESTMTRFEEDEDIRRKERVTSGFTVFEEDETPTSAAGLAARKDVGLAIDTNIPPTPRRSQGWWNYITTPFQLTPSSSRWTNRGGDTDSLPDVPILPQAAAFGRQDHEPGRLSPEDARKPPPSPNVASPSTVFSWESTSPTSADDRGAATTPKAEPHEGRSLAVVPTVPSIPEERALESRTVPAQVPQVHVPPVVIERKATVDTVGSPVSFNSENTPVLGVASIGTVLSPRPPSRNTHDEPAVVNSGPAVIASPPGSTSQGSREQSGISQSTTLVAASAGTPAQNPTTIHNIYVNTQGNSRSPETHMYFAPPPGSTGHSRAASSIPPSFPPPPSQQYDEKPKRAGCLCCFRLKQPKPKDPKKKKRRRCCLCIILFFVLAAILGIVLGVTLSRKDDGSDSSQSSSQWVNLTNYPAIPTGVATIAQPEAVDEVSGCVSPATLWSCAVPKEQQDALAPNDPDQPNFRLVIAYKNGSEANLSSNTRRSLDSVSSPVSAGAFIRSRLLKIRDAATDFLFTASPAVPSTADQQFIGNTTDKVSEPFEGEDTPFYITFLTANKTTTSSSSSKLKKRATSSSASKSKSAVSTATSSAATSSSTAGLDSEVPAPVTSSDGTALPANLLPFPSGQPLKLYDRGLDTEHYGFYTYFDRSIFLKSLNTSEGSALGGNPADVDGGASFDSATERCTWAQTRFRVQIWTGGGKSLLAGNAATTTTTASASHATPTGLLDLNTTAARDFSRPGSFPLPVTISLDRHGGNASEKMVYCYGMDGAGRVLADELTVMLEDRGFGGVLVNPASSASVNVSAGGVDGGTGGCGCEWRNWGA